MQCAYLLFQILFKIRLLSIEKTLASKGAPLVTIAMLYLSEEKLSAEY